MKTTPVFALAVAAGAICSAATAQESSVGPLPYGGEIAPSAMIINGVRYPLPAASRSVQPIYDNGVGTFPIVGAFTTGSTPRWHVMDDISFNPGPGAAGGRLLTSMTISLNHVSTTLAGTTGAVAVRVQMWDRLDTAMAPITQDNLMDVTYIFNAPAGGWALAYYTSAPISLVGLPAGGVQTADDAIYFDQSFLTVDAGNPTTTPHTDWTCIFGSNVGNVQTVGSSARTYYRDSNASGDFQSTEGPAGFGLQTQVASLILSLSADAPALTGGCCMRDGTCQTLSLNDCNLAAGAYQGDSSACGTCEQPGACCLPGGSCSIVMSAACTTAGGVFQGAGSSCAAGQCFTAPVLWSNGPLATGAVTSSGNVSAPAGTQWAEVQFGDGSAGASTHAGSFHLADDFTITAAGGWQIDDVTVYAYLSGNTPPTSPFTAGYIQIWTGAPNAPGSTVVFGDFTTNRLVSSTFSNLYRIFNTVNATSGTTRPIYANTLSVGTTLPPGTYWVEYATVVNSTPATAHFAPNTTIVGSKWPAVANGMQLATGTGVWTTIRDGNPAMAMDFPFVIRGQVAGSSCYANCDNSTTAPVLNVGDFTCFLQRFAAGESYANCDNSTTPPVLNVGDFTCFLQSFAAGCP
jgi:hypothetical protein